ncbi:MAG: radical SAM protein [Planctomycetes bacterium]|nr:radical SAM protein [Planctomycetota bacterium]
MTDRLIALLARLYLGKPDLAAFVALRLPDRRALLAAARNELAFRLGRHRAARLTTLNVELTSRCNVACSYCDTNRALGRPNTDLDLDVLARLLERAPTVHTLLPFQWGEPLLYEPLDEAIALAARRGVRTYLTTNGTLLDGPRFVRLARAGLTRLTLSLDGDAERHAAARGYAQAPILRRLAEAREAQRLDRLPTALDVSMVVDESSAHTMDALRAAVDGLCDRVQFIPRLVAGRRASACREPSRGVMVVLSDGRVTTCCADVRGELALGRVDDTTDPVALYRGDAYVALRRAHRAGAFPAVCARCDEACVPGVSKRFT